MTGNKYKLTYSQSIDTFCNNLYVRSLDMT